MYDNIYTNERYLKKQARRALNTIAFTSIISSVLTFFFYTAVKTVLPHTEIILGRLLVLFGCSRSYAVAFAENFSGSEELQWFISILSTLICFFVPFAILAKNITLTEPESIVSLKGPVLKEFPFICCASVIMASASSFVTDKIFAFLFPDACGSLASDTVRLYGTSTSVPSLVLSFISMCILAPIAEEFVYRGIAFGYLKKFGVAFAALSASLLFGLAHKTAGQVAYALVFGIVLCAVTHRTGNLKTAIIIHCINNLIGYISSYIIPLLDFGASEILFTIVYNSIVGVFAIVGMIVLFNNKKKESDTETGLGEKTINAPMSCFFCAGTVSVILFSIVKIVSGIQ